MNWLEEGWDFIGSRKVMTRNRRVVGYVSVCDLDWAGRFSVPTSHFLCGAS